MAVEMAAEMIPIVLFLSLATVFVFFYWFRYRSRQDLQQTLRVALDKGQELSPEVIQSLAQPHQGPAGDRRRAAISVAIGIAVAAFALLLGEEDAIRPILAISVFPFMIGIAYLVISFFGAEKAGH